MDIDKMYGYSDAKRIMEEIARERQERAQQRSETIGYAAQLVPTGIKSYKSEQQIGAKELKDLEFGADGEKVFQTSAEHIDKPWHDPGKFFAKSRDMVEPTQGMLSEVTRLEELQKAGTITQPEMELLTKYKSYTTPDPAVGMSAKMKDLLGGVKEGLSSPLSGALSGISGGYEMLGDKKSFAKKSDAYKAATMAQTALGIGSLLNPAWALWSAGIGLGKNLFR